MEENPAQRREAAAEGEHQRDNAVGVDAHQAHGINVEGHRADRHPVAGAVQQPEDRQQQQDGDQRHDPRHVGDNHVTKGAGVVENSGAEKKRELPPNSTLNRFSRKKLTPMAVISMEIFDA